MRYSLLYNPSDVGNKVFCSTNHGALWTGTKIQLLDLVSEVRWRRNGHIYPHRVLSPPCKVFAATFHCLASKVQSREIRHWQMLALLFRGILVPKPLGIGFHSPLCNRGSYGSYSQKSGNPCFLDSHIEKIG